MPVLSIMKIISNVSGYYKYIILNRGEKMNYEKIKLTSAEIGTLWTEYVYGTMTDCVNRYMYSIIEDKSIKKVFKDAINIFAKQKQEITEFIKKDGFPVPLGFTDADINMEAPRLFTDIFCLQYLHVMTLHGLIGHITSLSASTRKDLRQMYDAFDNDGKRMFHETIELLLEKGKYQRDPLFYPSDNVEFVDNRDFASGLLQTSRPLGAPEIVNLSFNIKKNIMAKSLSIAFSQVVQDKEARKFLEDSQNTADNQIQLLNKILQNDNLPSPTSFETEITSSQVAPFSDKLMLYHIGLLYQVGQVYHGAGLASSMRADLVITYEKVILKNIALTKNWFTIMVKNKWLEQPPLAPNRKEIARDK
ncbi:Protein of unknown function [Natronincola peptidivorans]|uniref:DUF3231 family protein n=2 Tax=Natronincola peptidivorans TaxID=426128 RepID=A0A1I0GHZ4_9FIRM|nr:Protein of unknown function [Natronincola peptidivorans]